MDKTHKSTKEVIFDIETKSFFDETGSKDPSVLGVSLVSLYKRELDETLKEINGQLLSFWEKELGNLWQYFQNVDRIIGFNSIAFDVPVLTPYTTIPLTKLPHFDILKVLRDTTGHGASLDRIAKETLGRGKIDSGAMAIEYFRRGDPESLRKLKKYCEEDVIITRDIYDHGLHKKELKFKDRWNNPRVVTVNFSYPPPDPTEQIGLF